MSAQLYRRWMTLCKNWGVDTTKQGRDLGQHIRNQVAEQFKHGEMTKIPDAKDCEDKLKCLERICADKYFKSTDSEMPSSTGATGEESYAMISNEGLDQFEDFANQTAYERLKLELSIKFSKMIRSKEDQKTYNKKLVK